MPKKPIILIVEDDLYILKVLERTFEKSYEVFLAINGKEALERIEEKKPHVILSDIMMDEMDGIELKKELNKNKEHACIPFIFLTAVTDESVMNESIELGVQDYLLKPIFPVELREKVKSILENHDVSLN